MQGLVDRYSAEGGDFNADITNTSLLDKDLRASALQAFLQSNNMCNVSTSGNCRYTFKPTKNTLDYVVICRWQTDFICEHTILNTDSYAVSDHLPFLTRLYIPIENHIVKNIYFIAWNKCNNIHLNNYANLLDA